MARAVCKECKNVIDNQGICQSCGDINEIPKVEILLVDVIIGDKISIGNEMLICTSASKYSRGLRNITNRSKSLYYNLDFKL